MLLLKSRLPNCWDVDQEYLSPGGVVTLARKHRPFIANGNLYWTRAVIQDSIVTLPLQGGVAKQLTEGGLLPIWHPSERKIGYFFGDFRLTDMSLDLDAAVVGVDSASERTSDPSVIISGYHEDFPPA